MTGVVITTFNRPQYLKLCFESLLRADLSKIDRIIIVDDKSTDEETLKLINSFSVNSPVNVGMRLKPENKSIKDSLLIGFQDLLEHGCDTLINLDGDAIVRNDFVDVLLALHQKYPALITTGFNCNTLNRDSSIRHKHIYSEPGATFRQSVGGINMCFNRETYLKFAKPALIHTLQYMGNWDQLSCINSMAESLPVAVTVPSVVQHLGVVSSMNHDAGGEPADTAEDFKPLGLKNVTLIGVADDVEGLIHAAKISMTDIHFGAVKVLSCAKPKEVPQGVEWVQIDRLGSKEAYSHFVFDKLVNYVDTEFLMIFQGDGFIISAKAWTDEFFKFDVVGAQWVWYNDGHRCSNGGFCLRTRRLHEIIKSDKSIVLRNDDIIKEKQEDHNLGKIYRTYLEANYGIKFAPDELCDQFSIEAWKRDDVRYKGSFGFHGWNLDFSTSGLPYIPYLLPNFQKKIF